MTQTLVQAADTILDDPEVPEGKSVMKILDKTGDTKVIWDPDIPEEVASARRTFDELRAKGMSAFTVSKKGDKDRKISTFDPKAEALIMAPALVGG